MSVNSTDPSTFFLVPGELIVTRNPMQITTVLGSCVSVCLYDTVTGNAGINHFMLPACHGQNSSDLRYGITATERLIQEMMQAGSRQENLLAKLFGGADCQHTIYSIGKKNIALAKNILWSHQITIKASSVGGKYGRKLIFDTLDFSVKVKYLKSA